MSEAPSWESRTGPAGRRRRLGVRSLMAMVACAGAMLWSYRSIIDRQPTRSFLRSLQEGSAEERRTAALEWNPNQGDLETVVPALIRAATDLDPGVRSAAILSLTMIGSEAIRKPPTTPTSDSADLDMAVESAREVALRALGDPDPGVRKQGLESLEVLLSRWKSLGLSSGARGYEKLEIDPRPYLPCLLMALDDSEASVRDAAARLLVFFPRSLGPLLPELFARLESEVEPPAGSVSPISGVRQALMMARPGPSAVPFLIGVLKSPRRLVRCVASYMLEQIGPEAYPATSSLVLILGDPLEYGSRTGIREDPVEAAAGALSTVAPNTTESSRAISSLSELLGSTSHHRRTAAALALGNFGPAAAGSVPRLASNLKRSIAIGPSLYEAFVCVKTLAMIAPVSGPIDDVVSALIEATATGEQFLTIAAVEALGKLGPRASAALARLHALESSPPPVQEVVRATIQSIERPGSGLP